MVRRGLPSGLLLSLVFLTVLPLLAHLLFSRLGFNPTDDGFTLAYARRLLEGQVPHRDFIIIRPALSPLIHVPFVLWGGAHTYLASRLFVWFQFAAISWVWVHIILRQTGVAAGWNEKLCLGLVAFVASAHSFPMMAWHTVDALFLFSLGMALCVREATAGKSLGYFLLGAACLCKQSFLFAPVAAIALLGDWRRPRLWWTIAAPAVLYAAWLALTGAFRDGSLQLTARTDILSAGVASYLNPIFALGVVVGFAATWLLAPGPGRGGGADGRPRELLGILLIWGLPVFGLALTLALGRFILVASFGLFGLVVACTTALILREGAPAGGRARSGLLVLACAWCVSLSLGYNNPALAGGQLLTVLVTQAYPSMERRWHGGGVRLPLAAAAAVLAAAFCVTRVDHTYQEPPARYLTRRLDKLLDGGAGLLSNENTYAFLADLRVAETRALALGRTYAIIPDCAGVWVHSKQRNPLCIDWAFGTELSRERLFRRLTQQLEAMRDTNIVIVEKVEPFALKYGLLPPREVAPVVRFVREHLSRVGETRLFELYR